MTTTERRDRIRELLQQIGDSEEPFALLAELVGNLAELALAEEPANLPALSLATGRPLLNYVTGRPVQD